MDAGVAKRRITTSDQRPATGYFFSFKGGGAGGFPAVFTEYARRDDTVMFGRSTLTSIERTRRVGSGFDE